MKEVFKKLPILGAVGKRIYLMLSSSRSSQQVFPGSEAYWENRYASGGNSGVGSYGIFAEFKANILNEFAARYDVQSVIEFGCGDGNQLTLAKYPTYVGFDVSWNAVSRCQKRFASDQTKSFRLVSDYNGECADLALSLDVIYHLVEDSTFERYMRALDSASGRYIIIYASDSDDNSGFGGAHVKHRKFTVWIKKHFLNWKLKEHIPNRYPPCGDDTRGSSADFFIYEKS